MPLAWGAKAHAGTCHRDPSLLATTLFRWPRENAVKFFQSPFVVHIVEAIIAVPGIFLKPNQ